MNTWVQIYIDENGGEVCPLPTKDERKQINEIQELMAAKLRESLNAKVGGGWGLMNTINCKMKCHMMCGCIICILQRQSRDFSKCHRIYCRNE